MQHQKMFYYTQYFHIDSKDIISEIDFDNLKDANEYLNLNWVIYFLIGIW